MTTYRDRLTPFQLHQLTRCRAALRQLGINIRDLYALDWAESICDTCQELDVPIEEGLNDYLPELLQEVPEDIGEAVCHLLDEEV